MNIINLHDKNLYYIGGVVRDKLLGIENFDVDITYVGDAIEYAKSIASAEIIQINEPFGTVKIKYDGEIIDIASTRDEIYPHKGHLPEVQNIGCSLKQDVLRRDFTVNALAMNTLTSEIIDYVGGQDDLKNKVLKVLHENSFIDDPTRIVRGLKFSVRFGFGLDENTKKLQNSYLQNINYDMSYKRLKKELTETFNLNSWAAFKKFVEEKIYKLVSPQEFELPKYDFSKLVEKYEPENIWIIYVGLLPDISNLPLTKLEQKIVDDFKSLQNKSFSSDFEIYKNFEGLNIESVIMFSTINSTAIERYFDFLKDIKIETTGQDLISLGLSPSPDYQKYFDLILNEKINNPKLTKNQELELVKDYLIP